MIYRIYEQDARTLLEYPETGMGYQIVNASQYERDRVRQFVIYNSDLAVELDSDFIFNKRKIINEGYSLVLSQARELMLETNSINVFNKKALTENRTLSYSKKNYHKRHFGGNGATDNPKERADGYEVFVRISAYENDKRIDFINRKLKSGTFTTTFKDYKDCISTNDDPNDRYALPNDEEIKCAFYIRPNNYDFLQRGIVQPAFEKDGGGIEAYFDSGSSNGSYLMKREYGK